MIEPNNKPEYLAAVLFFGILISIIVIMFSLAATDHGVPSPGNSGKVSEQLTW